MVAIRFMRKLAVVLALGTFVGGCFQPAGSAQVSDDTAKTRQSPCFSVEEAERFADQVVLLVNLERAEAGLAPVAPHSALQHVADEFACRMVEADFFAHLDPVTHEGPGERALAGHYRFLSVGENLASGPTTAADVMKAWMASQSHRDVILDERWQDVGVAVRLDNDGVVFWVQEFGDPAPGTR